MVRKTTNGDISLSAVMWIDRNQLYLVSTASSTIPGSICKSSRHRKTEQGAVMVETEFTQLKMVEFFNSVCSKIDQPNRCKQAELNSVKKIQTKSWAF